MWNIYLLIIRRGARRMDSKITLDADKQKKKRKKPVLLIAGIIGFLVVIQGFIMSSSISKYESKIYPEVWVDDTYVGGKTKEEAKKALVKNYSDIVSKKNIIIKVNDKQYTINISKLDMKHNYSEIIDKAYNIGRNENVLKKYFAITAADENKLKLTHTYNFSIINSVVKDIVKDNSKKTTNATITRNNSGQLIVTKDKYGLSVDSASIVQAIKNKVNNIDDEEDLVIKSELKKVNPKIKASDLTGVNTRISSVTTNFINSNANRSENIRVAAAAINGKIVMPGEIFSFNDVVGDRTAERGFKTGKEIIGDKVVDGIGGGVCQVSTTLYNAILRTNITSVERYQHSLKSSYIGAGLDATVAYGLLDYRFKNTYSYPIYLESSVWNKNVTFSIYSNESLSSKTYDILNEKVGGSIHVSRITYENNKFLSKVLLYTDNIH